MRATAIGIIILLLAGASCSQEKPTATIALEQKPPSSASTNLGNTKQEMVASLLQCMPERWAVSEITEDSLETYLAHIGKADFELHFVATYSVIDTLFDTQLNKKVANKCVPEIWLHFYKHSKHTKSEARFVQDNPLIISSLSHPKDFGETSRFLVYEYPQTTLLRTPEKGERELRECLVNRLSN